MQPNESGFEYAEKVYSDMKKRLDTKAFPLSNAYMNTTTLPIVAAVSTYSDSELKREINEALYELGNWPSNQEMILTWARRLVKLCDEQKRRQS